MKATRPYLIWRCVGLILFGILSVPSWLAAADKPSWEVRPGHRFLDLSRVLAQAKSGNAGLTLLTPSETGIHFTNWLEVARAKQNNNLLNGAGVAAGDYDRDGFCDLYFCNLDGTNALYRNRGGWSFQRVEDAGGASCVGQASTGAAFADVDGDGWLDLVVTSCGGPNALLINDRKGRFVDRTSAAGLTSKAGSTSLALADADGDGDLDLYVANYADLSILRSGGEIQMRMTNGQRVITGKYADRLRIVQGRMIELGEPDSLYLNDGLGVFTPVSWTGGRFLDEAGKPLAEAPQDLGLSVMFRDLNGDRFPDLYVCNDYEGPDRFWINDGTGRFRAIEPLSVRQTSRYTMGVDVADVNRDGFDDLFVVDMLSRFHSLRMVQMIDTDTDPRIPGRVEDRPQIRRNTLLLARGDGSYTEVANYAGLAASDWSWCTVFLDIDLDGYEDVLVANGHEYDIQNLDSMDVIKRLGKPTSSAQAREHLLLFPRLSTPNCAFRNQGDLTFREQGDAWGFNSRQVSHGIALADLDNDGDQDVVVSCLNAPPLIYRNNAAGPRVGVRLKGLAPNTAGIGARLRVRSELGVSTQEIISGGRYLSGDEASRSFAARGATEIEVLWRGGRRSWLTNLAPNALYEVDEAAAVATAPPGAPPPEVPFFEDASDAINHTHVETLHDDFARQPLLPRRLSQLGPGVSWFDLDGDGDDDLIVGCGKGGRLGVFRNEGAGKFASLGGAPFDRPMTGDLTSVLGWTSSDQITSLMGGRASYEDASSGGPAGFRFDLSPGRPVSVTSIPAGAVSSGPLAMADIDGDGDLDLFLGGRMIPGAYPNPASSRLFRNQGGKLELDIPAGEKFFKMGMVSAATFSDLDNDGFPELVIASDWGPIRIFRNLKGQFHEATAEYGLGSSHGWWNGVATGDLDGDGRLDIIASNLGLNTSYSCEPDRPIYAYAGDLDEDGRWDILEAFQESRTGKILPRRDMTVLGAVLPMLRNFYSSHAAFAQTDLTQILQDRAGSVIRVSATTLASTAFLNRGDTFVARPLPAEAQWAPGFAICVADLDNDGAEDVFLGQNDYGSPPDQPRMDAGLGLWMRGDGRGGLVALPPQQSGVVVHGEQRGAAVSDYDEDGRIDFVVTQNGGATKLFHNVRANPGLRVRLRGSDGNRSGIGSTLRAKRGEQWGALREIRAGSGYWSQDGVVQVLSAMPFPSAIKVVWPGGLVSTYEVPANSLEVELDILGSIKVLRSK